MRRVATIRPRQRGNVATMFALVLPMLLGFVALVVDLGHLWLVRAQLQNAADSAALAGVRELNGTIAGLLPARLAARTLAAEHLANNTPLVLDTNTGNAGNGDIVLGTWDFGARSFTPSDATTGAGAINAVLVNARRTQADGSAVKNFFGSFVQKNESDVAARAIAVGGPVTEACGFPVAIASCALNDANGNFQGCPSSGQLTFSKANKNTGITIFKPGPPVNGNLAHDLIEDVLAGKCNSYSTEGSEIYLQNGNDPSQDSVNAINAYIQSHGPLTVQLPVIEENDCPNAQMNHAKPVAGWIQVKLTGASWSPDKQFTFDPSSCSQGKGSSLPGGGNYGLWSDKVYLGK